MNAHDSVRMEDALLGLGYGQVDEPSAADLFLVNTCSIREKAEHKLMSLLGRLRPLKAARPHLVIVVAGCVAQQEGDRLLRKAPMVDLVIGPDNIPELPALLADIEQGAPPRARTVFDLDNPTFLPARQHSLGLQASTGLGTSLKAKYPEVSSFVTIMKGCDERCTYCIVPYTRGPERYRSADSIIDEVRTLSEAGVREITLLGQTVNSWYEPDAEQDKDMPSRTRSSEFASLLRRIAQEAPKLLRLRYTSPHPKHITPELIQAHADLELLPRHVHMPVQSGSNAVLKRMLRRYTREEYIDRVQALQNTPNLTLSTDIIVGFPGESEEDFESHPRSRSYCGFCLRVRVQILGTSLHTRTQTKNDVSEEEKDRRLQALLALVESQQQRHLHTLVGTKQKVLMEASDHGKGRSERNEIVHFDTPNIECTPGALLEVTIEEAYKHSLRGRVENVLVEAPVHPKVSAHLEPKRSLPIVSQSKSATAI